MTTGLVETTGQDEMRIVQRDGSGVMALATMSEGDFDARLVAMRQGLDRMRRIQREILVGPSPDNAEGEDYGVIPGTKKPTLFKPGAEKICQVYGLVPSFVREWKYGDGITTPHMRIEVTCYLHRGSKDGPIVGEGVGAANSWEKKHRYRGGGRSCPACGVEGSIRRSSYADDRTGDKGYYCAPKASGCNAKFPSDDPAITSQEAGQVENPDPYDTENTLLKMAAKRAQVDAVLRTTATSGLFAQDLEDAPPAMARGEDAGRADSPRQDERPPAARAESRPAARATTGGGKAGALPKWTGPCPRCGKTGAVIVSKQKPGFYHCWAKATRVAGCSADFGPDGPSEQPAGEDLSEFGVE